MAGICFVDPTGTDWDVSTPARAPLGGTQSAAAWLAQALVAQGLEVHVVSGVAAPRTVAGVKHWPAGALAPQNRQTFFAVGRFDAVVALSAARGVPYRADLPPGTLNLLWVHYWIDQPALADLDDPACRDQWDAFVCVSRFLADALAQRFQIPRERLQVIENAVGRPFESLYADRDALAAAKFGVPTVFAYTSTPFRGLLTLADAWRRLTVAHGVVNGAANGAANGTGNGAAPPPAVLRVASGMALYGLPDDPGAARLLAWLDQLPAVERVAPMAQTQLAGWLRTVHWLAYPCTWIETSCISVMEAYAAGCRVLATDLGALPETCAGRADLLPHGAPDLASLVAQGLLDRIVARQQDPTEGLDEAWERVCYANQTLRWDDRARRWALLFKAMAA